MDRTKNEDKKHRSFYLRVAVVVIAAIIVLMFAFSMLARTIFIKMIETDYSNRMSEINEVFIHQIDTDEIEKYLSDYQKNDYYYEMLTSLYKIKAIFQLDAVSIIGRDGRYIFNSAISINSVYNDTSFGLVARNLLPGVDEVFDSGAPFRTLRYTEDANRGGVYYLYSPVVNSRGNVIAVLGLEINAQYLRRTIFNFEWQLVLLSSGVAVCLFAFIIWYCRNTLSKPLLYMKEDIERLAAGELGGKLNKKLLRRKDEFGLIYKALENMNGVLNDFFINMNTSATEVLHGNLSVRMPDRDIYRGNYHEFLLSTNRMLDNNQRLLDMMPSDAYFYDRDFNIIYQNEPALNEDAALMATATTGMALEENSRQIRTLLDDFKASGAESSSGTTSFRNENGDVRYYEYFFIWLGKERSEIYAIYSDVTSYIEMSKKAEASSKSKSEFLSRMSHELRTPLNSIKGMAQISLRETKDEKMKHALSVIEDSTEHLLMIISDVLEVSEIEYGKMKLALKPFELSKLLGDVLRQLEVQAKEKEIRLKIDVAGFEETSPKLLGDETRLRQVVINLISNAIKFSPNGETVVLKMEELPPKKMNATRFRLSVIDHGIGVAPKYQQKIFESFEQGGANIARRFGGTGLGLPISNKIIALMNEGASIGISSEEGKGSTFFFELELENFIEETPPDLMEAEEIKLDLTDRRILLVDDIEINRDIVRALLEDSGADIEDADDGTTAIEMVENSVCGYYDIILMDIRMKEMDGDAATRAIRALSRADSKTIKIIGMSANAFRTDIELALQSGMNAYVTKPVDYNNMVDTIIKTIGTVEI